MQLSRLRYPARIILTVVAPAALHLYPPHRVFSFTPSPVRGGSMVVEFQWISTFIVYLLWVWDLLVLRHVVVIIFNVSFFCSLPLES